MLALLSNDWPNAGRFAELAVRAGHYMQSKLPDRTPLVEAEFLDQPLPDLRRGVRVLGREEIERAAGREADDEEGDEGDADEQGDGEEEPAEREQEHRGESKGRPS